MLLSRLRNIPFLRNTARKIMSEKVITYKKEPAPILRHARLRQQPLGSMVPSNVHLQVLGSGSYGAPAAIYIFTDHSRYLFNCGEGLQRLAYEHKAKLSRLEHVFFTRNKWSTIGGLPGLTLTLQDVGVKELTLHGPPHLDCVLQNMKNFVALKRLYVKAVDCTKSENYEDHVMTVKYLPLRKAGETIDGNKSLEDEVVIVYICKLQPKPGSLNLEKCVEYGVPPGPLLGQLKSGKDVALEDGKIIRAKDVNEPAEIPVSFIFLDIPEVDYIPALKLNSTFFKNLALEPDSNIVSVVHFSSKHILENDDYKSFVADSFPSHVHHLYLNGFNNAFSGYSSAHRIQFQLNLINPHIFPPLQDGTNIGQECDGNTISKKPLVTFEESGTADHTALSSQLYCLSEYFLRPPKGLIREMEAKLNPDEYIGEAKKIPSFLDELKKLKPLPELYNSNHESIFPKIIFMGTASCLPNKTRNVSGILVQLHETSYILLDCGEGTLGQIKRFFGVRKAEDIIRNLKVIYVSHLHADHHIGLIALLIERRRLSNEKLLLLAPIQIEPWLYYYDKEIEKISAAYKLISNSCLLKEPLRNSLLAPGTGLKSICTCLVRHCAHSFGVSFIMESQDDGPPIKITYSGDTMPCKDLVELGQGSTILIHEATMEDDLIKDAREKGHSTTSEALEQGRAMNAKYIILTHFSQRYAKLPRLQDLTESKNVKDLKNVAIAFDNMEVTLRDLEYFHTLYPALGALFVEYAEELDIRAQKRFIRDERKRKFFETRLTPK